VWVVVLISRRRLSALLAAVCLLAGLSVGLLKRNAFEAASRVADAVSGRVVVIDPGHGGIDPGAVGRSGVREADIVLSVAKRLQMLLNRAGVETIMTREEDVDLAGSAGNIPAVRKRQDLSARVRLSEEASADLVVSIHANSFPSTIWSGAQTFYREGCVEGRRLAVAIQSSLVQHLGPNSRKAKSADLFVLNKMPPPVALVEIGFLSNQREESLLASSDYQQSVAEAIFDGIVAYLVDLDLRKRSSSSQAAAEPLHSGALLASPDLPPSETVKPRNAVSPSAGGTFTYTGMVYFAGPTNFQDWLVPEQRSISFSHGSPSPEEIARALLDELVKGPGEKSVLAPVLPPGTKLRGLRVAGGLATVDFDGALPGLFWGGSRSEELTVYSIVNTLTGVTGIDRVKLTIDGRSDVSIAGHIGLDEEFRYEHRLTLETVQ
jgi:N-acetylmuramoyl-L-alanine amidase